MSSALPCVLRLMHQQWVQPESWPSHQPPRREGDGRWHEAGALWHYCCVCVCVFQREQLSLLLPLMAVYGALAALQGSI